MKKPTKVPWSRYLYHGVLKKLRQIGHGASFLFLHFTPAWKEITSFKRAVKNYPQFNKSYRHYTKYLLLYLLVRFYKPKHVLELGSGITTGVIKTALTSSATFVSMDEDEAFGEPVSHITGVPVHVRASVRDESHGFRGHRYEFVPEYPYDFVFVDGPFTDGVDLDAFFILEKNPRARVLIDCRRATYQALRSKYRGFFSHLANLGFINF